MNPVATVLVVVLLVSGMLAMGTSTSLRELAALSRRPAPLLLAVLVNLVAIPAAALVLLRVLDADATASLALMVVAAAPGGGTGALLSLHVHGDRAHAIALQVILAITSLVSAPLWLHLYVGSDDTAIRLGPLVAALVAFQWVPLALGLTLSERRPALAARLHPRARRFADLMLAALIIVLVITSGSDIDQNGTDALVGIGVVLGLTLIGGLVSLGDRAVRRASAMTTLVRNLSLALAAVAFVDDADAAALLVLTYGLAMYLLAVAWVLVGRRETPLTPAG